MYEENYIIRNVLECSKKRKSEGANIRSYILDYKDIIKPEYFFPQFIQDINYLDYNLKNENIMLNQLVDKLENFNTDKYPMKWINEQLDDAAKRLVVANYFSEYLESLKSSLDLNTNAIDQTVVAKYDELLYQIEHIKISIEKENKDIAKKSTDLIKIKQELKQLESDKSFLLDTNTSKSSRSSQETRIKIEQQYLENQNRQLKESKKKHTSQQNLVLIDLNLNQLSNINQEMKDKLRSLAQFFKIDVDTGNCCFSKNSIDFTNTLINLINNKVLNETTENLFIVILEDDYQKINLNLKEISARIRHELNVYLICRSRVINLIKMPSNRGTLKIKRETTDNYTEWAKIVLSKLSQQELVDEAISSIPEYKRSNNAATIKQLDSVKNDKFGREEEQKRLNNEQLKARQLEISNLKNRKEEIESELDYMLKVKADKANSLNEKQKLLVDLEPGRNAVLAKLENELKQVKNTNPRLYQLESKLNASIDYLRILCQRRELILNYIGKIKNFIMDQYSNEGFQTFIPQYIRDIFDFLRLKPYSE